jgi:hypothetical protein
VFAGCARQLAAVSGWGESFVGIWLLGCSAALPDLMTSITACRLGAFELAVSSLYGPCAFNMVVFLRNGFGSPRPIFSLLDPVLALSGVLAVLLMLLGVAAVTLRRYLVLAPTLRGAPTGLLRSSDLDHLRLPLIACCCSESAVAESYCRIDSRRFEQAAEFHC